MDNQANCFPFCERVENEPTYPKLKRYHQSTTLQILNFDTYIFCIKILVNVKGVKFNILHVY